MHILHLNSAVSWRGGEQQLSYLVEQSIVAGIQVTVGCIKNSSMHRYCVKQNIPVLELPLRKSANLHVVFRLNAFFKKTNIDLVHVHSGKGLTFITLYNMLYKTRALPIVIHRRIDNPIKTTAFNKLKYTHPKVKSVVCVSRAIADVLTNQLPEITNRVNVIYSGIDLRRFQDTHRTHILRSELQISDDTLLVGNISALADHKDLKTFIRTIQNVRELTSKKLLAVIIGQGKEEQELKAYVRELELESTIIFTGFRNDIPSIIKDLDIFLMTSKTEGLGTTVFDAMINEVPVISTKAGGIPEYITNKATGLLCDISDEKGLSQAVLTLLEDSDLKKSICQNAKDLIEAKFTHVQMAKSNIENYRLILAQ